MKTPLRVTLLSALTLFVSSGCYARGGYYAEPVYYTPPQPVAYVQPYPVSYHDGRHRVVVSASTSGYRDGYVRPNGYAHSRAYSPPAAHVQRRVNVPEGRVAAQPGIASRPGARHAAATPQVRGR